MAWRNLVPTMRLADTQWSSRLFLPVPRRSGDFIHRCLSPGQALDGVNGPHGLANATRHCRIRDSFASFAGFAVAGLPIRTETLDDVAGRLLVEVVPRREIAHLVCQIRQGARPNLPANLLVVLFHRLLRRGAVRQPLLLAGRSRRGGNNHPGGVGATTGKEPSLKQFVPGVEVSRNRFDAPRLSRLDRSSGRPAWRSSRQCPNPRPRTSSGMTGFTRSKFGGWRAQIAVNPGLACVFTRSGHNSLGTASTRSAQCGCLTCRAADTPGAQPATRYDDRRAKLISCRAGIAQCPELVRASVRAGRSKARIAAQGRPEPRPNCRS